MTLGLLNDTWLQWTGFRQNVFAKGGWVPTKGEKGEEIRRALTAATNAVEEGATLLVERLGGQSDRAWLNIHVRACVQRCPTDQLPSLVENLQQLVKAAQAECDRRASDRTPDDDQDGAAD